MFLKISLYKSSKEISLKNFPSKKFEISLLKKILYKIFIVKKMFNKYLHTVHELKLSHFFRKKTAKKCDNLGTFTQKILFLDYSKTKKVTSVTI